jgi:arginine decarboxylase
LRQQVPTLQFFSIGGGMPTSAYCLDFNFDYLGFLHGLMRAFAAACMLHRVPQPTLVGEFGRYTVASHTLSLMRVGAVKVGQGDGQSWYLLDGSLMVTLPDIVMVPGQQFIVLPRLLWIGRLSTSAQRTRRNAALPGTRSATRERRGRQQRAARSRAITVAP